MADNWSGKFTFEQVEKMREAAQNDLTYRHDIATLIGDGNTNASELIVNGPTEQMITQLKEAPEGDQIYQDFDNLWGIGASEHYKNLEQPHGLLENLWEGVVEAPIWGTASAAAELEEAFANHVARPLGNLMFGSKSDQALLQVERLQERVERLTNQGADQALIDGARADLLSAREEVASIEAMSEEEVVEYNKTEVELDANNILNGLITKPDTMTGKFVAGAVQFAAPFVVGMGGANKLSLIANSGTKGRILAGTVIGMVTDAFAFDEDDPLMVTAIADYFEIDSKLVDDYLRFDEDDPALEQRFKRAIEGAGLGVAMDGIMYGLVRAYRKIKKAPKDSNTREQAIEDIRKILEGVEAEDLQLPRREGQGKPKSNPWHFDPSKINQATSPDVAPSKVVDDMVREASEKASPNKAEGVDPFLPRTNEAISHLVENRPKSTVTPEAHKAAIERATRIWEATRQVTERRTAWSVAKEYLRTATDTLSEHGVRTREQIGKAVRRPLRQALQFVDAGDIKGLRDWADIKNISSMTEMRMRQAAVQMAARSLRAQTDRMAYMVDEALGNGALTVHEREVLQDMFHKQVQFSMEVEALNANLGSAMGAALGQRAGHMSPYDMVVDAVKKAEDTGKEAGLSPKAIKKLKRDAAREADKKIIKEHIKEGGGNDLALSKRYLELTKRGVDPITAFKRVKDIRDRAIRGGISLDTKTKNAVNKAKKDVEAETRIEKALRALEQWRYNAMLSGIATHETNFLSSFAQVTSRLAYEAVWGAARGNKQELKLVGQKLIGMTTGMKDSLGYAMEAYMKMKPILDDVTQLERLDPVYKNHLLTWPTRLMLGSDQFLKSLTYRGEVRASASLDADLIGLKGTEREAFIKERMTKAFDKDTGVATDALALERAQEVTFQKHFDPESKYMSDRLYAAMTKHTSSNYLTRFAFPFMRIFFRLTDEGLRMTPFIREGAAIGSKIANVVNGVEGSSKYWDDLMGHNGKPAQARAVGEYAVGLGITAWTVALVLEGRITGGEETNWLDADMRRRVIPPYHIRIGDKWYPYERFEPFAFPMKFWANSLIRYRKAEEANKRGEFEKENQMLQAQIGAFAYAFGESVSNNSFMEGLESFYKMTTGSFSGEVEWQRPVHTFIDSFVPNIIKKANQSFDDTGYKYTADPLTIDAFARHVSSVVDMESVDIQRNKFTGEPILYNDHDDLAGHHLFVGKPAIEDKVMELLIEANENTGKKFNLKTAGSFITNTDLKEHKADDGKRSLYDYYQDTFSKVKVNGRTYREALELLADDPEFQKIPWGNKTRVPGIKAESILEIKRAFEAETLAHMRANSKNFTYLEGLQGTAEINQEAKERRVLTTPAQKVLGID